MRGLLPSTSPAEQLAWISKARKVKGASLLVQGSPRNPGSQTTDTPEKDMQQLRAGGSYHM
jgi:hypothetical protein